MEIKRVIAGGLTTLAAGATMVLGVGAQTTLGDFVTVSGNTMTSPYIVIGDNAAAEDTLAAADVAVALAGQATETVTIAGSQAMMSVSGGALVETKSDKLYFGEALNSTGTSFKFTAKELPDTLATQTFKQRDGDDVEVNQKLYVYGQSVAFEKATNDWETPELYLEFADNEPVFNYVIRFTPAIDVREIENKEITLLGTKFVLGEEADQLGDKITMFESSQTESIAAGESLTVTVEGTDYVITVVGINDDGSSATIDVNGETESYSDGDDVEQGDLEAHVKDIRAFKFPVESGSVELFIGSSSTVLEHGQKVTLGGDDVDDALVTIDNSSDYEIKTIEVRFDTDDDITLKVDETYTEPVFGGSFDIAFGGMAVALDASSKDLIRFEANDDDLEVSFTNLDGNEYEVVLVHTPSGSTLTTADGSTNVVHFANNATLDIDEYVVVTDNTEYSYILQFTDVDSDDQAILEDMSTGTEYKVDVSDIGGSVGIGSLDVEVLGYTVGGEVLVLNNTAAGINTVGKIVTYSGAAFWPDVNATSRATGEPDETFLSDVFFFEEDTDTTFDGDSDLTPADFNISLTAANAAITNVDVVGVTTVDDDDNEYTAGLTTAGTYVYQYIESGEDEWVELYVVDDPVTVGVAFGDNPVFGSSGEAATGTVEQAVQIKNSISKMESEVSTATLSRDLVLLGGPCANGLVATVLEMSASNPDCATEFTALYPTEGVITVVEDAFESGQKALVIAGVNRAATRDLAVKVMQGTLDYSA